MPANEYEISAHTGQRFRSGGWNNGVGFRLCMQVIPESVNEYRHQDTERDAGAELNSLSLSSHVLIWRECTDRFSPGTCDRCRSAQNEHRADLRPVFSQSELLAKSQQPRLDRSDVFRAGALRS